MQSQLYATLSLIFAFLFEATNPLPVRIMPHPIRIERTILTGAETDFGLNSATAINAFGAYRLERT